MASDPVELVWEHSVRLERLTEIISDQRGTTAIYGPKLMFHGLQVGASR